MVLPSSLALSCACFRVRHFPKPPVITAGKASADTLPLEHCKHLCMAETPMKTFSRAPGSQAGNKPLGQVVQATEGNAAKESL